MNIAVLNGSPKGEISVTVQYIRFLQKKYPAHKFRIHNISHQIKKLETNVNAFDRVIDAVRQADGVIWAFPVYVFLVASQYKRFIELIWERGAHDAFKEKYACALSTSIHFFDHTAHRYIREICEDLEMKVTDPYSAEMDDIFSEKKRDDLVQWAGDFLQAISEKKITSSITDPVKYKPFRYKPGKIKRSVDTDGLKISVLADVWNDDSNVSAMVKRLSQSFKEGCQAYNINEVNIKGGCLGCLQCSFDNVCIYKDGFVPFVQNELSDTDVVVFAGAISDRFLSSRIKRFWDRSFFKGHIPWHMDKQVAFLVSGPLSQLPNLQEILQAHAEMQYGNLAGIVTDESRNSATMDALLDELAAQCVKYAKKKYMRPKTFLGVGGHKIFRDAIWSRLRFPFDADFKFYKEHGLFDFPHDDKRYQEFSEKMIAMIQDPQMRQEVRKALKTEMLKVYERVVEEK